MMTGVQNHINYDVVPEQFHGRHVATLHVLQFFTYKHLPPDLQEVSRLFAELAEELLYYLSDGPELTVALRKLLEAKDAAVRHALLDAATRAEHAP
jgi:hypothetical protein